MIKNELTGEIYSVEYFKNHIPKGMDLFDYLLEELHLNNSDIVYELLMKASNDRNSMLYHVDTYLENNTWRVQLKIKLPLLNKGGDDVIEMVTVFRLGATDSFLKDCYIEPNCNTCLCKVITFKLPYIQS